MTDNARNDLLKQMTLENLGELAQTVRGSLEFADKTAETLRNWLRLVDDEIDRKLGF